MRENIQRYLQFQITINICACIITLTCAIMCKKSPFQPIQLFWINLALDFGASYAMSSCKPMIDIMSRRPIKNQDYIISRKVSKHIIGQALYQCLIILVLFFNGEYLIPESNSKHEWPQNPGFVYPGRASDLNSSVIYSDKMASEIGPSRHLTFVFTAFVFMQVCNMIASRAIFDEINIF